VNQNLRIATRKSPLALWQSEFVCAQLRAHWPNLHTQLVPLSTRGDQILDRSLATIGGKGLFLKELEEAMARGEADLAVHSLKDVPMQLEPGFAIGAVLARATPFDALVSNSVTRLGDLPEGARVGTSSLRRHALLRALRPDLRIADLRGNVNTRLAKLDAGEFDAILLAAAGLERLGFADRIAEVLLPPLFLPAAAQGAIAIEYRADQAGIARWLAPLHHPGTAIAVSAERALTRALEGSCQVPIAAYADAHGEKLRLRAMVGRAADGLCLRAQIEGAPEHAEPLGVELAQRLLALGAAELLHP
jgi:hydroxymethylbilane synthase